MQNELLPKFELEMNTAELSFGLW